MPTKQPLNPYPYVIETAFGWRGDESEDDRLIHAGVNWSSAIKNPFRSFGSTGEGLEAYLRELYSGQSEPVTEGRGRKADEWKLRPEQSENHWLGGGRSVDSGSRPVRDRCGETEETEADQAVGTAEYEKVKAQHSTDSSAA